MKNNIARKPFYWLFLLLFLPFPAGAQSASQDSAYEREAYAAAIHTYHRYLRPENGLYNGGEYADYTASLTQGYPYFGPNESQPGWIVYNGMRYDSLELWYDLVTDAVVLKDPDNILKIQLINERLRSFSLGGHLFLRVQRDSINDLKTGFYELLCAGRVNLYKKPDKNLQTYATQDGLQKIIYSDSSYYIERADHFLPVNRKSSILKALADKKPAVRSYIRKNRLSIRKNKEEALLKIVTYYNGLAL